MPTDQPHSRARLFRFSLGTLFLLVTVFIVWIGFVTNRAWERRLALEGIGALGGGVLYENVRTGSDAPGPEWLRLVVGDEYFVRVVNVVLAEASVDDVRLEALLPFAELQRLDLTNTQLTDAGLLHLETLTNLIWLKLEGTRITDSGLLHLKGLTKLQYLNLGKTQVSDAGLVHLKELTNLQSLNLSGTQISRQGYEALRLAMPNCEVVPP